ncbi:MBOAT family O-acyltransferase [Fannyhessea vaginae]|uniref:MBOAT family O-acyltransferase n=1 Tax=Fannyhessea vaginae TaxID=82135 RepID=UPI003B21DE3B
MEFYSLMFVCFCALLCITYYAVGYIFKRFQWVVILIFSLIFYALVTNIDTIVYVAFTLVLTYVATLVFHKIDSSSKKRLHTITDRADKKAFKHKIARIKQLVLIAALMLIAGCLCYLKYWNTILYALSLAPSTKSLGLLLPLGISFYTFQALSYVFDIYNQKYTPEQNPFKLACYLIYFPQLIQGPINRFDKLAPHLFSYHAPSDTHFGRASVLFCYGALKKYVMADLLVDSISYIFDYKPASLPGSVIVFGILLYSAQQYADFSGGIDMVEATSEFLGIPMQANFRRPYFSISLADFWRRWHISLGLWMKDYVFYPLALTRPMKALGKCVKTHISSHLGKTLPAALANIFVFLLVGVWHGADAHFIWWGLYNGLVIATSDIAKPLTQGLAHLLHINQKTRSYHVFSVIRCFIVVNIGWYFDRIFDAQTSFICLYNTVFSFHAHMLYPTLYSIGIKEDQILAIALSFVMCVVVFVVSFINERGGNTLAYFDKQHHIARYALYIAVFLVLVFASYLSSNHGGFMYANY